MTENFDFVLDAWAILAHFGDEIGAKRVREVLKLAEKNECTIAMSLINVGEVAYITERERGITAVHEMLAIMRSLPVTIYPVSEKLVMSAAHIKANQRLSYADAFAAATAELSQGKLLTGDPELKNLKDIQIQVEWLPE